MNVLSPLHSLFSVWTGGTAAAGISGSALPARAAGHTNVPSEGKRRRCLRTSTTEWRRTKASPSPAVIKPISPYAPKNWVTRASLYLPLAHFLSHSLPLFFAHNSWGTSGSLWSTLSLRAEHTTGHMCTGKTSCSVHHTHTNIQDPWCKVG